MAPHASRITSILLLLLCLPTIAPAAPQRKGTDLHWQAEAGTRLVHLEGAARIDKNGVVGTGLDFDKDLKTEGPHFSEYLDLGLHGDLVGVYLKASFLRGNGTAGPIQPLIFNGRPYATGVGLHTDISMTDVGAGLAFLSTMPEGEELEFRLGLRHDTLKLSLRPGLGPAEETHPDRLQPEYGLFTRFNLGRWVENLDLIDFRAGYLESYITDVMESGHASSRERLLGLGLKLGDHVDLEASYQWWNLAYSEPEHRGRLRLHMQGPGINLQVRF